MHKLILQKFWKNLYIYFTDDARFDLTVVYITYLIKDTIINVDHDLHY